MPQSPLKRNRPARIRRRRRSTRAPLEDFSKAARLWALRLLVCLGGHARIGQTFGFGDAEALLELIGLTEDEISELSPVQLKAELRERMQALEAEDPQIAGALANNVAALGEVLDLDASELAVLIFVMIAEVAPGLEAAVDASGKTITRTGLARVLSVALDIDLHTVSAALDESGTLVASGLLSTKSSALLSTTMGSVSVLDGLADALLDEQGDPLRLFEIYFSAAPEPKVEPCEFEHVAADFKLIARYLSGAVASRASGVNVLIHGEAGTGKTQLVRALAKSLDLQLYEIATEGSSGSSWSSVDRLSPYRLAQHTLSRRRDSVLLFDEIEDVFSPSVHPMFGRTPNLSSCKALLNRLLEENPVPTFWLSNEAQQIEPAYLRRFDYILELRRPGPKARRRMLERHMGSLDVTASWMERMALNTNLQPAHAERAARVVRCMGVSEAPAIETTFERVVGNTLVALGLPRRAGAPGGQTTRFCPKLANTDRDLDALLAGIAPAASARLCLFGPPGTGKTAFAHYLAEHLGCPALTRRASDVLGMYVGETERNLAAMFEQARAEGAVLVLDEADGLLRDRTRAERSWELTQVNELLVQMEAFDGIFVASTNLMESLDAASLRRFDLKIGFDYLQSSQAEGLLAQVLDEHGATPPTSNELKQLLTLGKLAPGDFATAVRQSRITGLAISAQRLIAALAAECAFKDSGRQRGIGSTAAL